MKCPKCRKGELQEDSMSLSIGICDNLECGAVFEERGSIIPASVSQDDKKRKVKA